MRRTLPKAALAAGLTPLLAAALVAAFATTGGAAPSAAVPAGSESAAGSEGSGSAVGSAAVAVRPPDSTVTRHVIVVSVDGLRPDAIDAFGLAALQRLREEGSHAREAHTVVPSKTLPSHTSMLTGVSPLVHGITFNQASRDQEIVGVPTIFERARSAGYHTAAFFSKAKFRHLDRAEAYDYRQAPAANLDNWMATRTVPDAIRYMRHERPNLLFVHIGETDYAGHATGWMSFFYGIAARRADAALARLVEAAERAYGEGGFTLIVTSDHGGHGRSHGSDDPLDTAIPWIVYGQGVEKGARPPDVRTVDTAATALWLLGLGVPSELEGRPVRAAFSASARRPAAGQPAS